MNRFTTSACNVLKSALNTACDLGHTYIGSEHLLLGLLCEKNTVAYRALGNCGVTYEKSRDMLLKSSGKGVKSSLGASDMTPRAKSVIENSYHIAFVYNCRLVATEHLLLALIREEDCVATRLLTAQGVSTDTLDAELCAICSGTLTALSSSAAAPDKAKGKSSLSKSSLFGKNLTELAISGGLDPVIGREKETLHLIRILSRRSKNNPVLVGEPGVGKTAVVEGLAQLIADGSVPENLLSKQIISLDMTSLIAGAKYRGEFEERFKQVIDEACTNPNIILFIDEIHNLVGAGGAEGAIDGANILKPMLARGQLRIIGATTFAEYRKIEKDAALERRFQPLTVEEPSVSDTVTILRGLRDKYEAHHKIRITDGAISSAVTLSARYISDRFLPDKAIDLMDEACARAKVDRLIYPEQIRKADKELKEIEKQIESSVKSEDFLKASALRQRQESLSAETEQEKARFREIAESRQLRIDSADIEEIVTERTGIPVSELCNEGEKKRFLNLEKELEKHIIGQKSAVEAICNTVRRSRLGLKEPNTPMGSFIFAGPSGVGKTESAKVLARAIFGGDNSLIALDMSEYGEKHSISKLIGAPAGYVGYEDGGRLTERVRKHPYSVILFDEIEKAHPDICNLLLQILDEGRLSDSFGRTVNFSNTVIILTTNLGAEHFKEKKSAGFSGTDTSSSETVISRQVSHALSSYFKNELLGRIDEIVIFSPLSKESCLEIVQKYLDLLRQRLKSIGVSVSFTENCINKIASEAFSKDRGARMIRRYIQNRIEKQISLSLLGQNEYEGAFITVDTDTEMSDFVIITKKQ